MPFDDAWIIILIIPPETIVTLSNETGWNVRRLRVATWWIESNWKKKKKGEEKNQKKKLTWTRLAGWKRGRRRGLSVSWTIFALPVALTEAIVVGSAELSERIETRRAVGARVRMAQIRIRLLDGEKNKKKKEGKETIHYSRFTATTHPSIWGGQTFARANK